MQAALAQLAAEGVPAGRIADLSVATWRDIDAILSPIIGQRGVSALYKRSLYLTRAGHPALATAFDGELGPGEFDGLRAALSQQTSPNAAAAHGALLQTFHDLLARLLGTALIDQLLGSVLNELAEKPASDNPGGHAVQDTSP